MLIMTSAIITFISKDSTTAMPVKIVKSTDPFQSFTFLMSPPKNLDLRRGDVEPLGNWHEKNDEYHAR